MEYALIAVGGWVGGGWVGYPSDDPDSPMCDVCVHILGAIAAVILWLVVWKDMLGADSAGGALAVMAVSVLSGSFAASLVRGVMKMAGIGRKAAQP